MSAVLILIVLILIIILCLICACVGFVAGRRVLLKTSQKTQEETNEQEIKAERLKKEYEKFLNYDGTK